MEKMKMQKSGFYILREEDNVSAICLDNVVLNTELDEYVRDLLEFGLGSSFAILLYKEYREKGIGTKLITRPRHDLRRSKKLRIAMELSVALVVFLLKTGIKQLDENYSAQSFIGDVLTAFGEKTGNKLIGAINKSHNEIDYILKDDNLVELGIESTRTALVRANVKETLKQIKITKAMLSNYDCDAQEITDYIIANHVEKTFLSDDFSIHDIRRVVFKIIQTDIDIAKKDGAFINDIIIETHKNVKNNTSILNSLDQNTLKVIEMLEEQSQKQNRFYNEWQRQKDTIKANIEDIGNNRDARTIIIKENLEPKTLEILIDLMKGGQGNGYV